MKITVANINKALERIGAQERLRRGRGYFYFADGEAHNWNETAVYVNRVNAMPIEEWVAQWKRFGGVAKPQTTGREYYPGWLIARQLSPAQLTYLANFVSDRDAEYLRGLALGARTASIARAAGMSGQGMRNRIWSAIHKGNKAQRGLQGAIKAEADPYEINKIFPLGYLRRVKPGPGAKGL